MGVIYSFDLFVSENVDDYDNVIKIDVLLSDAEHDRLLETIKKYYWDTNPNLSPIRDFYPELNDRVINLALPKAIEKWGDAAKLENGAQYEVDIPEDIENEFIQTEDYKRWREARERMDANYEKQRDHEQKTLTMAYLNGRWPHFSGAGPISIFGCYLEPKNPYKHYAMDCMCMGLHIHYRKQYTIISSTMSFIFYGKKELSKHLIESHLVNCGRDISIKEEQHCVTVEMTANEDDTDVEVLMAFFDDIESELKNLRIPNNHFV